MAALRSSCCLRCCSDWWLADGQVASPAPLEMVGVSARPAALAILCCRLQEPQAGGCRRHLLMHCHCTGISSRNKRSRAAAVVCRRCWPRQQPQWLSSSVPAATWGHRPCLASSSNQSSSRKCRRRSSRVWEEERRLRLAGYPRRHRHNGSCAAPSGNLIFPNVDATSRQIPCTLFGIQN